MTNLANGTVVQVTNPGVSKILLGGVPGFAIPGSLIPGYPAGNELGYAEVVSPFTTTNFNSATLTKISGLLLPLTGTGQAVDLEFYAPTVFHSVANTNVAATFVIDGVLFGSNTQLVGESSPSTSTGPSMYMKKRLVLSAGAHTIEVSVWGGAAGTSTLNAGGFAPITLSATGR